MNLSLQCIQVQDNYIGDINCSWYWSVWPT